MASLLPKWSPDPPGGLCHASALPMWGGAVPTPALPAVPLLIASVIKPFSAGSFQASGKRTRTAEIGREAVALPCSIGLKLGSPS